MVYELCSLVCKNYSALKYQKSTLLLSLEIGFRHLNPKAKQIEAELIHTEHHQKLAEVVFDEGDSEAIADLLCAWTSHSGSHQPYPSLQKCVKHLIGLHHSYQSSARLRQCVIVTIGHIGYELFEQAGVVGLAGFLNNLQICEDDMGYRREWLETLLDTIQCSAEPQYLSYPCWELLLEHATYWSDEPGLRSYNPHVTVALAGSKEWDKLRCWIGVVWMMWPPGGGVTTEEELKHVMLSLSHQKPDAIQELEKQIEKLDKEWSWVKIPESFQQICKQAYDNAVQQPAL